MDKTSDAANLQLVDFYPFLRPLMRVLPETLNPMKRNLREIKIIEDRLFFELLKNAKQKIKGGKVYPSNISRQSSADKADRA